MLEGAHMLCRERGYHVNLLLEHIIYHAPQLVRRYALLVSYCVLDTDCVVCGISGVMLHFMM